MNFIRLYEILEDCTVQIRRGEIVSEKQEGRLRVVTIDAMPSVNEVPDHLMRVDMELLIVGVDKAKAEQHREEFIALMNSYPEPERLKGGPSYIEVGAVLGSQGAAFQMFAMGKALDLWGVITPSTLGFKGDEALRLAGQGLVMMSGYPKK